MTQKSKMLIIITVFITASMSVLVGLKAAGKIIYQSNARSTKITNIVTDHEAREHSGANVLPVEFPTNSDPDLGKSTASPPINGLGVAGDPHLRQLARYQKIYDSFVADELMVFLDVPLTSAQAQRKAEDAFQMLKEFARFGVKPLVVVEPLDQGMPISVEDLARGHYDDILKQYFSELRARGISDADMGTWVPYPEANTPFLGTAVISPELYGRAVNKYLTILREYFPEARTGILLDTESYPVGSSEWVGGLQKSLREYVGYLDASLIDTVGIQGFPWMAGEASNGQSAADYLAPHLLVEMARILGVDDVWLNTGTYRERYIDDKLVRATVEIRRRLLSELLSVVLDLQGEGLRVAVNIFAENKISTAERTNWSYLGQTEDQKALADFIVDLRNREIGISLYDSE